MWWGRGVINFFLSSGWWEMEKYLVRLGEGGGHKNFVDLNENVLDPTPIP